MESCMTMIASTSPLSVALSLPVKITGRNSDYQLPSELTATISDRPGHILRQRTTTSVAGASAGCTRPSSGMSRK
jgi:hypothetical protein